MKNLTNNDREWFFIIYVQNRLKKEFENLKIKIFLISIYILKIWKFENLHFRKLKYSDIHI